MSYPFLSQPPPQKKRPSVPPPSVPHSPRRRSATTDAISTWLAHVLPASPTPTSPPADTSLCDSKSDLARALANQGYTAVFVHLPTTPRSPARTPPRPRARALSLRALPAMLSSKNKPKRAPSAVPAHAPRSATPAKGSKIYTSTTSARPPPLATEVQLAQLLDGGSFDSNVRRVMHAHARTGTGTGVGDVFRGADGAVWWDQDEEWEYARLIEHKAASSAAPVRTRRSPSLFGLGGRSKAGGAAPAVGDEWVEFGEGEGEGEGEERRGSVSSQDSDLDPQYAIRAPDAAPCFALPAPKHMRTPPSMLDAFSFSASPTGAAAATAAVAPTQKGTTDAAPHRARGSARRRRPEPLTLSPPSPAFQQPSNTPPVPAPAHTRAHARTLPPPATTADARRDFLAASFAPAVPAASPASTMLPARRKSASHPRPHLHSDTAGAGASARFLSGRPSKLDVRALFKGLGKKD